MQSRRMALAEAATNVAIGFVFAILVQGLVFPLVGLKVTFGENVLIGAAFTVASVIRGYVLRRIFERIRIGGLQREAAAPWRTAASVGMWVGQLPMRYTRPRPSTFSDRMLKPSLFFSAP
jgi:hypothetical protein